MRAADCHCCFFKRCYFCAQKKEHIIKAQRGEITGGEFVRIDNAFANLNHHLKRVQEGAVLTAQNLLPFMKVISSRTKVTNGMEEETSTKKKKQTLKGEQT